MGEGEGERGRGGEGEGEWGGERGRGGNGERRREKEGDYYMKGGERERVRMRRGVNFTHNSTGSSS